MLRFALLAVLSLCVPAAPVVAGPRDELLRVAPADAAIVVVVQNARDHVGNLSASPFGKWFPSTAIGKKVFDSEEFKQLTAASGVIFATLGTSPQTLLNDVFGDAFAFAYSPAPSGQPGEERAVLLIRPRNPEALKKLVTTLNDLQTQSGEIKQIVKRQHAGAEYFARQRGEGGSQFYCFRGGVFAFSTSEVDIKAVIDRDKAGPPVAEKEPRLVARMKELGVADALGVILVNPRALDDEMKQHLASAGPGAKRFLQKFAEGWKGLDSAAVYLALDRHAELGLSLRFNEQLPPDAKTFLAGLRRPTLAEHLIPEDALFGVAEHFRASDLVDLVAAMAPIEPGKPGVKDWLERTAGTVIDRQKLPVVLESLGPNWAVWAAQPEKDALLPTFVAAIEISGSADNRQTTEQSMTALLDSGFLLARIGYNSTHDGADRISLVEKKDAKTGAVIRSLVNEEGFPAGFQPSFAIQHGYLLLATHPGAIMRFQPPRPADKARDYRTLARFSGTRCRDYLQTHGAKLAKFLALLSAENEEVIAGQLAGLADVLELIDSADVIAQAGENKLRIAVRVNTARPLGPLKK